MKVFTIIVALVALASCKTIGPQDAGLQSGVISTDANLDPICAETGDVELEGMDIDVDKISARDAYKPYVLMVLKQIPAQILNFLLNQEGAEIYLRKRRFLSEARPGEGSDVRRQDGLAIKDRDGVHVANILPTSSGGPKFELGVRDEALLPQDAQVGDEIDAAKRQLLLEDLSNIVNVFMHASLYYGYSHMIRSSNGDQVTIEMRSDEVQRKIATTKQHLVYQMVVDLRIAAANGDDQARDLLQDTFGELLADTVHLRPLENYATYSKSEAWQSDYSAYWNRVKTDDGMESIDKLTASIMEGHVCNDNTKALFADGGLFAKTGRFFKRNMGEHMYTKYDANAVVEEQPESDAKEDSEQNNDSQESDAAAGEGLNLVADAASDSGFALGGRAPASYYMIDGAPVWNAGVLIGALVTAPFRIQRYRAENRGRGTGLGYAYEYKVGRPLYNMRAGVRNIRARIHDARPGVLIPKRDANGNLYRRPIFTGQILNNMRARRQARWSRWR